MFQLIPLFGLCTSLTAAEVRDISISLVAKRFEDALARVQATNHHLFKLQRTV